MTPFQRLAAFDGADGQPPNPGWTRTAPVLRVWAAQERIASIPAKDQADAICTHIVRVWVPPVLAPHFPEHATALRAVPHADGWRTTRRVCDAAWCAADDAIAAATNAAAANVASCASANAATIDAAEAAVIDARGAARDAVSAAACTAIYVAELEPDPAAAFARPAEEWIALAAPSALALASLCARAPGLLDFARDPADADAYAVAWGVLGDAPTWGTDDGRRVRDGLDADGATIPTWARRTALARCLVRMEIPR